MTEEKEVGKDIGDPESARTRKVWPALAFLANLLGFGLGYVYVGELRLAIGMFAAIYGLTAFFAWTRLIVWSATIWWLTAAIVILIFAVVFVHPTVIAIRNRNRPRHRYNRWWFYLLWIVVINGIAFAVTANRARLFGYEPFRAPTESMSPTIEPDEFFLVDTWRYSFHKPSDGDIVVFERPDVAGVKYVKRVVGVPGDRLEARHAVLYRNGEAVAEPYLHGLHPYRAYFRDFGETLVGPGEVFVLGDYRDNSLDSRAWGPIPIDHLHGRAEYIWFSLAVGVDRWSRVGVVLRP